MRRIYVTIFILFALTLVAGMRQAIVDGDKIIGRWRAGKDGNIIEIYKDSGKYFGKFAEVKTTDNKALKVGTVVLKDFIYNDEDKIWEEGFLYAPKRNENYKAQLELKSDNELEVTGKMGVFKKSIIWIREE